MPINVKHGANPSLVLAADFATGRELERKRLLLPALQAEEARKAREDAQANQAAQIAAGQQFQREMVGAGQDFQRDQTTAGQGFQREMTDVQFGNQTELIRQRQEMEDAGYEFRLTAQQKSDQEKYQNALYEIEQSDAYTPEEKVEAKRRVQARLASIEPLPTRKEPSKFPEGQDVGQAWTTPEGLVMTRQADGNIKKIGEDRTQPTWNDKLKRVEIEQQRITNALKYAEVQDAKGNAVVSQKKYNEFMSRLPPLPAMPGDADAAQAQRMGRPGAENRAAAPERRYATPTAILDAVKVRSDLESPEMVESLEGMTPEEQLQIARELRRKGVL